MTLNKYLVKNLVKRDTMSKNIIQPLIGILIILNVVLLSASYLYVDKHITQKKQLHLEEQYYQKKEEEISLQNTILAQSIPDIEQNIHALQEEIRAIEEQQNTSSQQKQTAVQQQQYYEQQLLSAKQKQTSYLTQISETKTLIAAQKAAVKRTTRSS